MMWPELAELPCRVLHDPMMWHGEFFRMKCWVFDRSGHRPSMANWAIEVNRRSRFMRSFYFADRDLRDRVILTIAMCAIVLFLIGPWFELPDQTVQFLIGPGFNSQARSTVSGQCDSWPMSLAPTNGDLGWWGKNLIEEKNARWLL